MNLFSVKVVELKNAARRLLDGFWWARAHPVRIRRRTMKDYTGFMEMPDNLAIYEKDLPNRKLRRLFAVLQHHLRREQFSQDDVKALTECLSEPVKNDDIRVLTECLNEPVRNMVLMADLSRDRLTCQPFASSLRVCAENIYRYFELLAGEPKLMSYQPLGLCSCGRVFMKAKRNQRFCSDKCYFKDWAAKNPKYWEEDSRLVKRGLQRTRAAGSQPSVLSQKSVGKVEENNQRKAVKDG